ncbi:MAG: hypothetical protein IKI29_05840 [Clostridia bacterium]|nr:hypothetical protein [Clostridia bacterium]
MPFQRKRQTSLAVLSVLLILVVFIYTVRLYFIQTVTADAYKSLSRGASARSAVLKAPRGEILDCYGRQIAINRDGYNIVFNKAYVKDNLNKVILRLTALLSQNGIAWNDTLPISSTAPYTFSAKKDSELDALRKKLSLAHYATAENCCNAMIERYQLSAFSPEEQRILMGVRYSMEAADFSITYPFTFAEDIPTELMRQISESGFLLSGVSVDVVPFRQYVDTSLAVNLIGTVGPIFAEDWEGESGKNYKSKGYSFSDKVGKGGIEEWAEEYLHGTDGEITYYIDGNGTIVSSEVTKAPIPGKTVMLTLDKNIQRTAQNALETTVRQLQSEGGTAKAGAAVMINIHTGGVLCGANYPTYDSATMNQNYNALLNDPRKPLTDRAFQGVYPIGSTIKPAVAVAALENHHYTPGETICCVHTYNLFADYKPSCMRTHGYINLKTALAKSCNYFFFELGRRVGALTMTEYFEAFGLGVPTGVEVDDSKGLMMHPKNNGLGGDTLQIAIGQMNAFTPLQLANYAATLSNGGTHYQATLIDKITSYDLSEIYDSKEPVVKNKIDISDTTLKAVKEGMLSVTVDGTGRAVLHDYPIKIGGKTGTSETDSGADHSTYIVFAPYENPQIAISVILEHGNSGYAAGTIIRNLLDAYFFANENPETPSQPYTVLP